MNRPKTLNNAKYWKDVMRDNYFTTKMSLVRATEEVSKLKRRLDLTCQDMTKAAEDYRRLQGDQPDCGKCRFMSTMKCQNKEDLSCFKRGPIYKNGKDICPDCGGVLDVRISATETSCKQCPFSYSWRG